MEGELVVALAALGVSVLALVLVCIVGLCLMRRTNDLAELVEAQLLNHEESEVNITEQFAVLQETLMQGGGDRHGSVAVAQPMPMPGHYPQSPHPQAPHLARIAAAAAASGCGSARPAVPRPRPAAPLDLSLIHI